MLFDVEYCYETKNTVQCTYMYYIHVYCHTIHLSLHIWFHYDLFLAVPELFQCHPCSVRSIYRQYKNHTEIYWRGKQLCRMQVSMYRWFPIQHVKDYPPVHYFAIPSHTQLIITVIWSEWNEIWKIALTIMIYFFF